MWFTRAGTQIKKEGSRDDKRRDHLNTILPDEDHVEICAENGK
ncbi:MAG TPA: hypothetical protein VNZ43_01700 [Sphingomonadaceae bacterium]|nr:hypothetical protein [Sphingomonadaceae bacterium]